ncbi:hypothetical protein PR002_g15455 [Phytophthora rubi]|uniref:Uncharacterized protein n=1 Tax=Phytophthora rubi TaxID=129364 RepID=A0A6A3L2N7_9STRA|nr:hypothetical protein PR002_g15455 [Phytophthora rubi]
MQLLREERQCLSLSSKCSPDTPYGHTRVRSGISSIVSSSSSPLLPSSSPFACSSCFPVLLTISSSVLVTPLQAPRVLHTL